jgi:hypothetical protein
MRPTLYRKSARTQAPLIETGVERAIRVLPLDAISRLSGQVRDRAPHQNLSISL